MKTLAHILMKTLTLTLFVSLFAVGSKAQAVKPNVSNEVELIKTKAENWFKTVYVEAVLKDPYSYKHLKTIVTPITIGDDLKENIRILQHRLDTNTLAPATISDEGKKKWQDAYDDAKKSIENEKAKIHQNTDSTQDASLSMQRRHIHEMNAALYRIKLSQIDLVRHTISSKEMYEKMLNSLTPEESNKLYHYQVQIDCYSKNSLGKSVLGRFQFPFNKDGFISSDDGLENVKKINK